MIRTVTIPLDDDLGPSIDGPAASGRPASVAEPGATRDTLRTPLIEGEASGRFEDLDTDSFLASMPRSAARRGPA
ncbi:hypothetical protein DA075_01455 [Methylobacterium currus]|uniref:Uncharacterized protein n=1 Tax=Methylobacterium currus TaxID=2051553 RepID=A0A2R4WE24_9HYPH|nr:hypothetical protein [Methylobacterium currus]AWB19768.1 hypothetical protein DA075_01455 [Methylobacterium currus]